MTKISFFVSGSLTRCHDAAIVSEGEEPLEALVEAAVQTISTDVEIKCGDVTMHLAAWRDPYHWSEDWEAIGIDPDDVPSIVAAAVQDAKSEGGKDG